VNESNGVATHRIAGERREDSDATFTEVRSSAVGEVNAVEATIERSAVRTVRASDANVTQSAVGVVSVERGTVRQSGVGIVVAKGVACDEVRTGILAAPVVRGEVHTWLDLRTAVAIGLGMALGKAMLGVIGHLARRLVR
jgi:hypothetical protein